MPHPIRQRIEAQELEWLSPFATPAARSRGRETPCDDDPVRTCFQRDRDRILHSKPFRRLKHKTQVFIEPTGDHYRTRMTHTLEVAQIARTIARALQLNEDLTEAIALGHDVGHSPFGHAGEAALNESLESLPADWFEPDDPRGFRHYLQSLRVVRTLTPLNLTLETLDGIGGHSKGDKDLSDADGEPISSLEAAVVRLADRIAYMNHDLEDALRSGIIASSPDWVRQLGETSGKRIGVMVEDVIAQSLDKPAIRLSPTMLRGMNDLKDWLFENVYYQYPAVYPDIDKAKALVQELFQTLTNAYRADGQPAAIQRAVDFVSGMTDRYAMDTFAKLRFPAEFRAEGS